MKSSRALRVRRLLVLGVLLVTAGTAANADAAGIWQSHGPGGGITGAIAVDPSNPSTLYVTTLQSLYKSVDGGAHWHDVDGGRLPDVPHHAVVVSPYEPQTVFVANDAGIYVSRGALQDPFFDH